MMATEDRDTDEKQAGLVCRACGCRHFTVYYTRPKRDSVYRVRVCRHCGKRLLTHEKPA